MSGIAVFNAAVDQLQKSQRNLFAISQARRRIDEQEEDRKLVNQERELRLENMRRRGEISEMEKDVLEAQTAEYLKQEEDKRKGQIAMIKQAEHQERNLADQAMNWAKIGFKSDPQGVASFLYSRQANEQRTSEIRPAMKYGKIGYEVVDPKDGETVPSGSAKKATKPAYTRKDVITEARNMWEDEGGSQNGKTVDDFMEAAESRLAGTKSPNRTRNYKAGDQRNINGTIYIRNENGEWHPQR